MNRALRMPPPHHKPPRNTRNKLSVPLLLPSTALERAGGSRPGRAARCGGEGAPEAGPGGDHETVNVRRFCVRSRRAVEDLAVGIELQTGEMGVGPGEGIGAVRLVDGGIEEGALPVEVGVVGIGERSEVGDGLAEGLGIAEADGVVGEVAGVGVSPARSRFQAWAMASSSGKAGWLRRCLIMIECPPSAMTKWWKRSSLMAGSGSTVAIATRWVAVRE